MKPKKTLLQASANYEVCRWFDAQVHHLEIVRHLQAASLTTLLPRQLQRIGVHRLLQNMSSPQQPPRQRWLTLKYSRSLCRNWTSAVIYNKFKEQYSLCTLHFTHNDIKQQDSRKVNMPYWTGRAVCHTGLQITVEITREQQPAAEKNVTINVVASGHTCTTKSRS